MIIILPTQNDVVYVKRQLKINTDINIYGELHWGTRMSSCNSGFLKGFRKHCC